MYSIQSHLFGFFRLIHQPPYEAEILIISILYIREQAQRV